MILDQVSLDDEWYDKVRIYNAQLHKTLRIEISRESRNNIIANPESVLFYYPKLNIVPTDIGLRHFDVLHREISLCKEVSPVVIDLYQKKIEEKILLLQLLNKIRTAQLPTKHGLAAVHDARDILIKLFGYPDKDIFNHVLKNIQQKIAVAPQSKESEKAIERLSLMCGREALVSSVEPFLMVPRAEIESNVVYTNAAAVKNRFENELKKLGISDWHIVISEQRRTFRVQPQLKRIYIPSDKALQNRRPGQELTERNLQGLIAHEISTHVVRSRNGERSALKLLSIGLAGYLRGEEGIASYREQLVTGAKDYAGSDVYFALGSAFGLDRNGVPRSYAELMQIVTDYYGLLYNDYGPRAATRAFATGKRIFISTAHNQTNPLYITKDIAYREGNIAVYKSLKQNPSIERYFDIGKFDPTNKTHLSSLETLGVI